MVTHAPDMPAEPGPAPAEPTRPVAVTSPSVALTEDAPSGPGRTVVDCVAEFLVVRQARKHAQNTLLAYRRDLDLLIDVLARQAGCAADRLTIGQVTGRALRTAFAEFAQPRSGPSVGRAWSVWNQFFSFLVADGVVAGNPMGTVDRPRPPRRSPKPLQGPDTPEQLLESVAGHSPAGAAAGGSTGSGSGGPGTRGPRRRPWPERDLAIVAVLLCAGLRSSELLDLRVGSIDGRRGERFMKVRGKGEKERTIPIEPELDAVIDEYLRSRSQRLAGREPTRSDPLFVGPTGTALGRGGLQYLVGRAYREAGVSAAVPQGALVHALRHTFATRLAQDGASAVEIMRLLGHASLTTSQNYIDATAREQREAIRSNRTHQALRRLVPTPGAGDGPGPAEDA
ncbi:MAG TPA: tyrosine-type recombinase/integrase [Actinocrinis sp.]|nr:tyrosine-type recombinase/integrase [Actinocrinis sp.]